MNTIEQNHATKGKHTTTKIKPADTLDDELNSGAVLLGSHAEENGLITIATSAPTEPLPDLGDDDIRYLEEREKIVTRAVNQSLAAAKALHEIKCYRDGLLWRKEFRTFADYCASKWGYQKSHAYRLVETGRLVADIESHSPRGEKPPRNEAQVRQLITLVPEEHRVECWTHIIKDCEPDQLTAREVREKAHSYLSNQGIAQRESAKTPLPPPRDKARKSLNQGDLILKYRVS